MTQNQLNREVAQATGETVDFIRKRGFGIIITPHPRPRTRPRRSGGRLSANPSNSINSNHQPVYKAA